MSASGTFVLLDVKYFKKGLECKMNPSRPSNDVASLRLLPFTVQDPIGDDEMLLNLS